MKSEWRIVALGEIVNDYDALRIPLSSLQRQGRKGGYPYYGAQGVIDGVDGYIFDGTYLLIAEDGENLKSMKNDVARLAVGKFWVNNHAHVLENNEKCDIRFLCYLLNSIDLAPYITGSAQPKLNKKNLFSIELSIPSLPTQRKIAAVLSSLDDKIETNNAICRNLEEQAEALYKRLIATKGNESDIYAIADIIYGAPFASRLFNTEGKGMPLIRIRDLKRQYSDTYTEERHPKAYLIQPGDIVVGMDGEFQPYIWGGEEALLNQRVCVFQNKRAKGSFFLYFVLKPLLYRIEQTEMATTVIHIGKQDFDDFRFSMLSEAALREYEECTHPLYNQIVSLNQENRRLAALRDTLLPRLMSGELDVSAVKLD